MALGLSIVLSIVACERGDTPSTNAPTKVVDADSREAAIAAIERNLLAQRLDEASIVAEGLVASLPDDASAAAWFARVRVAQSQAAGANSPAREPWLRDAASALDRALEGGIDDDETLALAASVAESLGDHAPAGARWAR
ncbi:MAG: hypothetical protein ACO3Y3_13505, partial [Phycisphaerales bacterium]